MGVDNVRLKNIFDGKYCVPSSTFELWEKFYTTFLSLGYGDHHACVCVCVCVCVFLRHWRILMRRLNMAEG
jgi:hypothetical protein